MKLLSGERLLLKNPENFLKVVSGKIEVYAVTKPEEDFHQIFLLERTEGTAIFYAEDEFETVDMMIYAVEDSEYEEIPIMSLPAGEMKKFMQDWFSGLIKLSWLRYLADRGDEDLSKWVRQDMFDKCRNDTKKIFAVCASNENIFLMLTGLRLQKEVKRLANRIDVRKIKNQRALEESMDILLGVEKILYEEETSTATDEIAFIVKCTANALLMPADHLSINPDIAKKLDAIGLLRRLMQKNNMQMRPVFLPTDWYEKDGGVLIGFVGEDNEPAVLIPTSPATYKMVTKENPEGIPIDGEVAAKINRNAFACYAGLPQRKLRIRDLLSFIFRHSWKSDYQTILFVSVLVGMIPVITPIITETIFQDIIPILDREGLVTVTQVMLITTVTTTALRAMRSVAVIRLTSRADMSFESALWGRLLTLPEKFFRRYQSGELANIMVGLESVKLVLDSQFAAVIFDALFSFWSIFLMCYYSIRLTLAALAIWLVWCLIAAFIDRNVVKVQTGLVNAQNEEAGIVQQIFAGFAKFRIQGAEAQAYGLWSKIFGETWKWNLQLRWQKNYNLIVASIQPFIFLMILYEFAVTNQQTITYPQFLAFSAACAGLNATFETLIPMVTQFFTIHPHIANLRPIMEEVPETNDEKIDSELLTGAIKVSNLTFSYGENLPDVLKDISFEVAAGENLAIVGKSGCGKSTLVRLLLGFEKPKTGAIYFDGQDLSELNPVSVRTQMGVVLQNGQLMSGDIFSNIVGSANLTQDDAWDAAEAAGIADDIDEMPMGMQTVISEGSTNISGGQRQRILIARALASKPAILIFDEATSALDNRSQSIVKESIDRLHVTRIVIAHRLSTIKDCDRILVMEGGRIVESGTFDELTAKEGVFATLVRRQTT